MKSLQSGFKHVHDGGLQLQSDPLKMKLDNNININMPPIETKVLIIQRAWRDFLQTQEVEKRSPSPPSLSSSDKMSMSISMTTLSDGSTPWGYGGQQEETIANYSILDLESIDWGFARSLILVLTKKLLPASVFFCGKLHSFELAVHTRMSTSIAPLRLWALVPVLKKQAAITALPQTVSQQTVACASSLLNSDKRIMGPRRLNRTFSVGFEAWEKPGDRIKDAARNGIKEESVGN
ncbi:hypothetical protein KUCAC02_005804 [Chaenocephalus aceratus]|uniref:Uncharacterized protein n=1 Tax=Chaenocephalus aceratus TaxID=36190 RepID=A0ACB9WPD2_CHAAC|nr:hypothetical protein KUCAC02_005804 [Chaenocephalus aceratus]